MKERHFYSHSVTKIVQEELWYITEEENFLMHVNINTGEVKTAGKVPGTESVQLAYRGMSVYKDKEIFLLPYNARTLCVYDVEDESYNQIEIPENIIEIIGERPLFFDAVFFDDKMIVYGATKHVLIYDIRSRRFKAICLAKEEDERSSEEWYARFGVIYENQLLLSRLYKNEVYCLDLSNYDVALKYVGEESSNKYCIPLLKNNKMFYINESESGKVKVNVVNLDDWKVEKEYSLNDIGNNDNSLPRFLCGILLKNHIMLFPGYYNEFVMVDIDSQLVSYKENVEFNNYKWGVFSTNKTWDGKVISIVPGEKALFIVDDNKTKYIKMFFSRKAKDIIYNYCLKDVAERNILYENDEILGIEEYVKRIVNADYFDSKIIEKKRDL